MNRYRAWGLSAALAVGVAAPAAAADPPRRTNKTVFGELAKTIRGAVASEPDADTPNRPPTITAPLPPEVVAAALRAEQEAWERRMAVCLKLRQVAVERNDDALLRQVDDLERQATAVYHARVSALGVPRVEPPVPPNPAAAVALDDRLGSGAAVTPLTLPATPTPDDPAIRTADASTPTVSLPVTGGVRR